MSNTRFNLAMLLWKVLRDWRPIGGTALKAVLFESARSA
jgi:hypothetical protein